MSDHPTRLEHDSLGERHVPEGAYFGVQTLRAAENFDISGITIAAFPALLRALAMVKKAAALANMAEGQLPAWKCDAITAACDDVIAGKLPDAAFPVDVLQGGAGTSTNMNMNEVLANRALEHLGKPRGTYSVIHPNDDVNLSQSTNDVYPTAVRLAIVLATHETSDAVETLAVAFEAKAQEFADVVTLGRTQLQDAVPITLGQEFGAFAVTLREDRARLREATGLLREVNLGGTAVGTRINASPAYAARAIVELTALSGEQMIQAENLMEASWDSGAFVMFSGVLKRLATKLSKISQRSAAAILRSARRDRRDPAAIDAAGQFDHAGQGESGDPGGGEPGVLPGDRQRSGGDDGRRGRPVAVERLRAVDRLQPVDLAATAAPGRADARREMRARH